MHFWRGNIDLIDSSWLVIQIMIWINLILIDPSLSKSHLYVPSECMMLLSVVCLSPYRMLRLIWKELCLFPKPLLRFPRCPVHPRPELLLSFAEQTVLFLISAFYQGRWICALCLAKWVSHLYPFLISPNFVTSIVGFHLCSWSFCPSGFIYFLIPLFIYWRYFRRREKHICFFSLPHLNRILS